MKMRGCQNRKTYFMRTMEVHGTVEQNHRLNKNCCSGQTSGIALIIAEVVVIYIDDPAQLMEDSKVNHVKDYDAHKNGVTGLYYSPEKQWLLSCGKDKHFQHHSAKTGLRWGGYQCKSSCTAIAYDDKNPTIFRNNYCR